MKIVNKMQHEGASLFKYRGQIPILLFIIAFPLIEKTSLYHSLSLINLDIIQCTAVLISLIGIILRFYTIAETPDGTSGRNRNQQIADHLNKTGIYSIVRNPLYLANFIIWLGISIYSLSYILVLITSIVFLILYERIIMLEENYLLNKYPSEFQDYTQKTPIFFPNFKKYKKSNKEFSIKKILKQEYSSILSTAISFLYIDILLKYFYTDYIEINEIITHNHLYIFLIFIIIAIILKMMKKLKIL